MNAESWGEEKAKEKECEGVRGLDLIKKTSWHLRFSGLFICLFGEKIHIFQQAMFYSGFGNF